MRRLGILTAAALLIAPELRAQTVIRPEPPLDSARAVLRDALLVLRDSLGTIDGAAARLQRDYWTASGPALVARARSMRDACARSRRNVPPARKVVLAAELSERDKLARRRELVSALDTLTTVLDRCETEFASMSQDGQGERVRGYGNDRAVKVQRKLRGYERVMYSFLQLMRIRIRPGGSVPARASAG
jgi:hypothetical protein